MQSRRVITDVHHREREPRACRGLPCASQQKYSCLPQSPFSKSSRFAPTTGGPESETRCLQPRAAGVNHTAEQVARQREHRLQLALLSSSAFAVGPAFTGSASPGALRTTSTGGRAC